MNLSHVRIQIRAIFPVLQQETNFSVFIKTQVFQKFETQRLHGIQTGRI